MHTFEHSRDIEDLGASRGGILVRLLILTFIFAPLSAVELPAQTRKPNWDRKRILIDDSGQRRASV
jgi:hypothetical protein